MDASMASPVSGMRTHITRHDVTAHDVANVNTPGYEQRDVHQADVRPQGVRITGISRTPNTSPDRSNTDLAEEAKEQIVNKHANAANAKTIKVKDRMIDDLLDLVR
ncbi:MAG: hypothetical protein GF418_08180 [Chitinivibrionales bacterium]|nr:hypothetical protein [Chitinivibrionales bacterium]MBD3395591.1 hypothetical protein [Chitinivibrionales bacterium]